MKKILALLCVIALIAISMVPALANPSIGDITQEVVEVLIVDDPENPTEEWIKELVASTDWNAGAIEAQVDLYKNEDVKASVSVVNSSEEGEVLQPSQVVKNLEDYQTEESGAYIPEDIDSYRFVTQFSDMVLTDGEEIKYSGKDDEMTLQAKLQIDAMAGVQLEALSNYMIMQINPETGEIFFCPFLGIDADGYFIVELKVFGPFAVVQKL